MILNRVYPHDKNPQFEEAIKGFEGTAISEDHNGNESFTTFRSIKEANWVLVSVFPKSEALKVFNNLSESLLLIISVMISSFGLLAFYVVENFVGRIQRSNNLLAKLRKKLAIRLKEKTRYYNEVSHDLRTRVMGLKMTAHEGSAGPRAAMPMALSRLTAMSVDLHHYLDEFLVEARSEAVSVQVHLERVALGDTFLHLISQFEDMAAAQQLDLRCRMTPVHAMADRELLKRMLDNLVSNALRYARSRVLVTARRRGQWVEVAVRDNGEDMPPTSSQTGATSTPPQARTPAAAQALHFGLGLAMVRRSVKALGGTMHIKTVPGHGTVVVLRLVPGV